MITKMTKWLPIGLLCLALWPGTTHGQSPEFIDTYDRFARFYTQGRSQEALRFAEKALRLGEYEFGPNHPIIGLLFNNLATLYQAQGRYAEAEPLYQRSLAIREKAWGPEHPHVATSLENYAGLLRATRRSAEAAKMETRAKAIRAKDAGVEPGLLI